MSTATLSPKKLTDAQLVVLSSASQQPDGLLALKEGAHPSVGRTVVALLRRALLAETPVRRGQPCWRRDDRDKPIGAKITAEGLALLGIEAEPVHAPDTGVAVDALPAPAELPKAGTKQALIVGLLARDGGATTADLMSATGWLPHTTRAALSGLRRKGFVLDKAYGTDGALSYRLTETDVVAAAAEKTA